MDKYKKLHVWEKSFAFSLRAYEVTKNFPSDERFGLTSQIRRASVSIPSNIAEGKLRDSDKHFKHFLRIALGSAGEVDTQLLLARELGYIPTSDYNKLSNELTDIMKMLSTLIKSI